MLYRLVLPPHSRLQGILTHTPFPVLGQGVAAVALADEGARQVHTELLAAMVLGRAQVLD